MEKIADFFYDLKDRVTNPLFTSFIIAWLIYNWKIPMVLTFYKFTDLERDGYKSYIEFVSKNLQLQSSFLTPLCYALGYTFIFPILRMGILAFLTLIKTKSTNYNLRIAGKGIMPTERYLSLKENYKKQTKLLTSIIEEEKAAVTKMEEMQVQLSKENQQNLKLLSETSELKDDVSMLEKEREKLEAKLQHYKKLSLVSILNGEWEYKSYDKSIEYMTSQRLFIEDGNAYTISSSTGDKTLEFKIQNYCFNNQTNQISFLKVFIPESDKKFNFQLLNYDNNISHLKGNEDNEWSIEYQKII
ncbi:protein bicaudal D homolog [Chitinophaga filiformis]|uniref:protein bicaudal D homolog n=1 Tax=Chitinophaga filiformis TaxID=104663 RepID=UPI001F280F0C|nr:protein bicaudal D homolog [Chitinophaga filiformis]MCF6404080.1 protein bicaudal D homolog [Chitinophaga filiformis]